MSTKNIIFFIIMAIAALSALVHAKTIVKIKNVDTYYGDYYGAVKCKREDGTFTGEKGWGSDFTKRTFDGECEQLWFRARKGGYRAKFGSGRLDKRNNTVISKGQYVRPYSGPEQNWLIFSPVDADNKVCLKIKTYVSNSDYHVFEFKGDCNK